MAILVTGGAGFIGSNFILNWLASHDEPIVNLDKLTYAGNLDNLNLVAPDLRYSFIQGDILDSTCIDKILSNYHIRAIIHFAAESHVDRSIQGPASFVQTNVLGTFNLLESARNYWNQLPASLKNDFRFIHISTDEIYGSLDNCAPAFTEQHHYEPNSPYSASKAASNHFVRAYYHTYGLPVITTNCSNNYGPHQHTEKLIPLCIQNALHGKPLPIYGDGQQVRDWLFVDDHCAAIRALLEHGALGEVYNVGGWNEKTNLDLVSTICSILDRLEPRPDKLSYLTQISHVQDRLGHDSRYAVDASKIALALDWKPLETFESGIEKTVAWYLAQYRQQKYK